MTKSYHYGPGNQPVCGIQHRGYTGVDFTDDPNKVRGCETCRAFADQDVADVDVEHVGVCEHCGEQITATGGVQWRLAIRGNCPGCERDRWFEG